MEASIQDPLGAFLAAEAAYLRSTGWKETRSPDGRLLWSAPGDAEWGATSSQEDAVGTQRSKDSVKRLIAGAGTIEGMV